MRDRLVRGWFAVLAVVGTFGLAGSASSTWSQGRSLVNYVSYFTVESNLLVTVAAVVVTLAGRVPRRWEPVYLAGLVGISVTGVVYHAVLAGQVELRGMEVVHDLVQHTLVPVGAVLGFVLLAPRLRRRAWWFLAWPVLWLAWTLGRAQVADPRFTGPDDTFLPVPYDFLDASEIGWTAVTVNALAVTALLVGLAAVYLWLAPRLRGADVPPAVSERR